MKSSVMKIRDTPYWLVAALLLVFFAQGLFLIQDTSPTVDETAFHIVNGYVYLITHDYRMSPANPPLVREWMALPWLLIRPKLDLDKESWRQAESVPFSLDFFYKDNRGIADLLLYSARFMVLLLGMGLGFLIFISSKRLYGAWGGAVSLAAYTMCPSFIAHSAFGTIDVGATFFFMLAAFFMYRYLENSTNKNLCVMALCGGLMFAAKTNLLFFGPVFLFVILIRRGFVDFLKVSAVFTVISFLVVWACYLFEFKTLLGGGVPRVEEKIGFIAAISQALAPGNQAAEVFLKKAALTIPIPMPTYFLGIAGIIRHHTAPFEHFVFGEWTAKQPWYSYPFFFYAKMTIPFLILFCMRGFVLFKNKATSWKDEFIILFPAVSYFFVMCFEKTGNGSRYLFPAIALLCVWMGGVARSGYVYSRIWKSLIVSLLGLNVVSLLMTFPNYASYFNQLAGGTSQGYRYTRDSDVDWGQGLKALGRYAKKESLGEIALRYFGTADPAFYGISSRDLELDEFQEPRAQLYALSTYTLNQFSWTGKFKPTAVIAGSIWLYDFREGVR